MALQICLQLLQDNEASRLIFFYLILALILATAATYLPPAISAFVANRSRSGHLDIRVRRLAGLRWIVLLFIWIAPATLWQAPLTFNRTEPDINWVTVAGLYTIILAATLLGTRWAPGRTRVFQPRFGIVTAVCVGMTAATTIFCYSLQSQLAKSQVDLEVAYRSLGLNYQNPERTVADRLDEGRIDQRPRVSVSNLKGFTVNMVLFDSDGNMLRSVECKLPSRDVLTFDNDTFYWEGRQYDLYSLKVPGRHIGESSALNFQPLIQENFTEQGKPIFAMAPAIEGNWLDYEQDLDKYQQAHQHSPWYLVVFEK